MRWAGKLKWKSRVTNRAANFRGGNMKLRTLALFCAITLFATLGITVQTFAQNTQDQFITFDAAANASTVPRSINPSGLITGYYANASPGYRGFVRAADGTITTFDVLGAGTTPGTGGTPQQSINPGGVITGFYDDASYVAHGFVRAADGTITTFDVPGAGTTPGTGTIPQSINPSGVITGYHGDASFGNHGFVRAADG